MRLTLPLPPSANKYWRSILHRGKTRVLLSREGRAYKRQVDLLARMQRATLLTGDVRVSGVVYFENRRRDLDNTLKPLLDALAGGLCYANDRQVAHIDIRRGLDKSTPRVELVIEAV